MKTFFFTLHRKHNAFLYGTGAHFREDFPLEIFLLWYIYLQGGTFYINSMI